MKGRLVCLVHLRHGAGRIALGQQLSCQAKIGVCPGLSIAAELTECNREPGALSRPLEVIPFIQNET